MMLMVRPMVATLSRGVMFSRLLRPHPRVLGMSVCASTRCFLAGLSSGFSCVAIVATSSLFKNNCSCYVFLSYPFDSNNYANSIDGMQFRFLHKFRNS